MFLKLANRHTMLTKNYFGRCLIVHTVYIPHDKQENPAIADKPTRRKSLPKIAPIRRAYNVVADNTGLSSFV